MGMMSEASSQPRFFDARGNIYAVIAPAALARFGLPETAEAAARTHETWAHAVVEALCGWPEGPPAGAKPYRSDGLLIGPFQSAPPFDLLILNTDGTLAERSGNGLTIFATAQAEDGLLPPAMPVTLRVHHAGTTPSPAAVTVARGQDGAESGIWLELGQPVFGPEAVAARPGCVIPCAESPAFTILRLAVLNPRWQRTVFVRIGNPHAVTFLAEEALLPSMADLRAPALHAALTRIAFASGSQGEGDPCLAGINLQWAALRPDGSLAARIFERGEGPTDSSGTSATAVAGAARRLGLVTGPRVLVHMPGGTAPIDFSEDGTVRLFGTARPLP